MKETTAQRQDITIRKEFPESWLFYDSDDEGLVKVIFIMTIVIDTFLGFCAFGFILGNGNGLSFK